MGQGTELTLIRFKPHACDQTLEIIVFDPSKATPCVNLWGKAVICSLACLLSFLEMWEWELEDLERTTTILNSQEVCSVVFSCHNCCGNILGKYESDPEQLALTCNEVMKPMARSEASSTALLSQGMWLQWHILSSVSALRQIKAAFGPDIRQGVKLGEMDLFSRQKTP